jgi:hypothetical protein
MALTLMAATAGPSGSMAATVDPAWVCIVHKAVKKKFLNSSGTMNLKLFRNIKVLQKQTDLIVETLIHTPVSGETVTLTLIKMASKRY